MSSTQRRTRGEMAIRYQKPHRAILKRQQHLLTPIETNPNKTHFLEMLGSKSSQTFLCCTLSLHLKHAKLMMVGPDILSLFFFLFAGLSLRSNDDYVRTSILKSHSRSVQIMVLPGMEKVIFRVGDSWELA